ncbi:hypothetical protein DB347_24145 [Opitutaceae bacterium EW11]|nr:hypothetical protein DB347_24145 [Opitutaceae bacterium EW11]
MTPSARRFAGFIAAIAILIILCLIFPRVLAFTELAARELRYLWWLIAIAALGIYLSFFAGRKKD